MPFRSVRRICLLPICSPPCSPTARKGTGEPVSGNRAERVVGPFRGMSVRCSIALAWCSNCGECSDAVSDFRTAVSGCTGAFAEGLSRPNEPSTPRDVSALHPGSGPAA
jgi:hypothetical protein